MSDRWIIVRNWEKFQHRDVSRSPDTAPTWVRNYTRLLHNDDYLGLTFNQRGVLHMVWLEYAASDGRVRDDVAALTRRWSSDRRDRVTRATLESLNHAGFITFSASKPPKLSARLEEKRGEEKTPPTPPYGVNPNGWNRKPSREEIPNMVDVVTACQHFIAGRAWDDTFDEPAILEEFGRIERGRRTEGELNQAAIGGLLEQWKAARQDRYGIKADL